MKKTILVICLASLLGTNSYATEPFPDEEYVSDTGRYHAVLHAVPRGTKDWNENLLTLSDKKENKDYTFSLEQLALDSFPEISTAGLVWYGNSIAVFDKEEKFFIIRLAEPQYIVVDLERHIIAHDPPVDILEDAKVLMARLALQWLDSEEPYQRQTGAMVCKDLKISESIPRLKELLTDKEFYTTFTGNNSDGTIVLYVCKAAKEALIALGESADNIIAELPTKDCFKFKDYKYVIDWENEKCQRGK